tara:strand:- start:277 stop:561 length:285 start_codon:yes stop_codon:yes gene_type:complete
MTGDDAMFVIFGFRAVLDVVLECGLPAKLAIGVVDALGTVSFAVPDRALRGEGARLKPGLNDAIDFAVDARNLAEQSVTRIAVVVAFPDYFTIG